MKNDELKVSLIGFMGTGKTTLGKKLSKAMDIPFVDLDQLIETREESSIPEIFDEKGETYFRKIESELLKETLNQKGNIILSTGGGAPCFHNNIELITSQTISILLELPIKMIVSRIKNSDRPLVKEKSQHELEHYLTELLKNRNQFYSQASIKYDSRNIKSDDLSILIGRIKSSINN